MRILVCIYLITASVAQETFSAAPITIDGFLPSLTDLSHYNPWSWTTRIGGQNFTWCCTKAVNDSVFVDENNTLSLLPSGPAISLNLSALQIAENQGQFPCTASYDEASSDGSPEVTVSYEWLASTCPGWELNSSANLNGKRSPTRCIFYAPDTSWPTSTCCSIADKSSASLHTSLATTSVWVSSPCRHLLSLGSQKKEDPRFTRLFRRRPRRNQELCPRPVWGHWRRRHCDH